VGNHQHGHAVLSLESVQQVQNLPADRHIQGGRRLIGHKQARPAGQRHRDHRPLALPPTELVRIGRSTALGITDCP